MRTLKALSSILVFMIWRLYSFVDASAINAQAVSSSTTSSSSSIIPSTTKTVAANKKPKKTYIRDGTKKTQIRGGSL